MKQSGKAPAFQFYFDRFNSSTALWDDCQVGKYIRLMICQANKGYVSEKELRKVGEGDVDVLSKFKEVAPGQFANEVLTGILADRDAYRESRQKNRLSGLKKKEAKTHDKDMSDICQSHDGHMVGVVVDVVVDKEKGVGKEKKAAPKKNESAIRVMEYFNQATGRRLDPENKSYSTLIAARMKEGRTEQDLFDLIDYKQAEWTGTEFEKHIHPDTLFCAKHSQRYYDQVQMAKDKNMTASQIRGKQNGLKTPKEIMQEVQELQSRRRANGEV